MTEPKRLPRLEFADDVRLETLAVRQGLPATPWGENSEALFLTSSFVHPDAATAAARFAQEEEAFVYSRFTNPTTMMMERRLAALEGTEACIATSSGMAAIMLLVMGLLKAGDHVICSRSEHPVERRIELAAHVAVDINHGQQTLVINRLIARLFTHLDHFGNRYQNPLPRAYLELEQGIERALPFGRQRYAHRHFEF